MISASKSSLGLINIKILRPKVTKQTLREPSFILPAKFYVIFHFEEKIKQKLCSSLYF